MTTATAPPGAGPGCRRSWGHRVGRRTASRAAEVLSHRHRWDRRHLLPDRRLIGNAISSDKYQRQRGRHQRRRCANVNGIVGRLRWNLASARPDVNFWAFTRHRHLRGQAQGGRAARHSQSLPRERAYRASERVGGQVRRRPQGQAGLPRRARLRHARVNATADPWCLWADARRTSSPNISKQQQCAEKLEGRLSLDAYFQTTGYPQGTLSELRGNQRFELLPLAGRKRKSCRRSSNSSPTTEIPAGVYKDVAAVQTLIGRRPVGNLCQNRRGPRLCGDQGAVERQDAGRRSTPATPRARRSARRRRSPASAFLCMPAPRNSYKEAGLLK